MMASAFVLDITERKRIEEALRQQREWLRVTLNSIGDAVIAADSQGKITFLNPVAALSHRMDARGNPWSGDSKSLPDQK